jgi:two-component system chemotaxis response regulator CheB
MTEAKPIKVLVIDDSAVMRQLMTMLFTDQHDIEVSVAADPLIALGKMARSRPDVIVLDLELPRMDGLTFLERLMADTPLPVIVCSGHAGPGSELSLRALEKGALEIVSKPALGLRDFLENSAPRLLALVRVAASNEARRRPRAIARANLARASVTPVRAAQGRERMIALGASTGGTEALNALLRALPVTTPGIVVVQHMPAGFTGPFAERLNRVCALEVREARDGDVVKGGRVLIAPGGRQLRVVRSARRYVVTIDDGPEVSRHRPSVDALFSSVAKAAGARAVAALLTGMGDDGAKGLLELRRAGAHTLAQDEQSCVIFGMPREAIALGAATEVVALDDLPQKLLDAATLAH